MFCSYCGKEIINGSAFCSHCGADLRQNPYTRNTVSGPSSGQNFAPGFRPAASFQQSPPSRQQAAPNVQQTVPAAVPQADPYGIMREFTCNINLRPEPSIRGWNSCVLDYYADRLEIRIMATTGEMTAAIVAGGAVGALIGGSIEQKKVKAKEHLKRAPDYVLRYDEIASVTLMTKSMTRIAFIAMQDGRTFNAQIGKIVVQYLQECASAIIPPERIIIK